MVALADNWAMVAVGSRRRLNNGQNVEVRSEEEGFLGSWHPGRVVACGYRRRCVRYDHFMDQHGNVNQHTESVHVSPAIDGDDLSNSDDVVSNCRGNIRPLPPPRPITDDLPYGFCVDAYYDEAWWEGVIFDSNDGGGAETRAVFFPDLGDEMSIQLKNIRITLTWNEVTDTWRRRGRWLFLELIEKNKQDWPIVVSVKQTWYDLRGTEGFGRRIKDWTCPDKSLWRDSILETVVKNLKITLLPLLAEETPPRVPLLEIIPVAEARFQRRRKAWTWRRVSPAGGGLFPGAKFQPDAIRKYLVERSIGGRNSAATAVRKHLLSLGWKIEFRKDNDTIRFRYFDPDKRCHRSLLKLCRELEAATTDSKDVPRQLELEDRDNEADDGDSEATASDVINCKTTEINYSDDGISLDSRRPIGTRRRQVCLGLSALKFRPPSNSSSWGIGVRGRRFGGKKRKREASLCRALIPRDIEMPENMIFLDDGVSLLDCQVKLPQDGSAMRLPRRIRQSNNNRETGDNNDSVCSVCRFGGELILCDRCPSSYHKKCLSILEIPDGDWFCPSCHCRICKQSKFRGDTKNSINDTKNGNNVLACDQCDGKYHLGCLNLECNPSETWYCNKQCEEISVALSRLVGKPIKVGEEDNLTWTLVKSKPDSNSDIIDSRLSVAVTVMRECFEPLKDPHTQEDLIEDVIFSRESELSRINFRGFYTVLLERNKDLISVATVRVHGEKVAEVPLICTRSRYRRLGMSRLLLNELENKLKELGVAKLVLPAMSSTLSTWTGSFGYSEMTDSDIKQDFLENTFLDFQDTIRCLKTID